MKNRNKGRRLRYLPKGLKRQKFSYEDGAGGQQSGAGPSGLVPVAGPGCKARYQEFGGAVKVANLLREGLLKDQGSIGDRNMMNRLTKAIVRMIRRGAGQRGERSLELVPYSKSLVGLEMYAENPMKKIIDGDVLIQAGENRKSVHLNVEGACVLGPKTATHWQLVMVVIAVSDHRYCTELQGYAPEHPALNGMSLHVKSKLYPMAAYTPDSIVLTGKLMVREEVPATTGLVVCLGIEYVQNVDGQLVVLPGKQAMRIAAVL